MSKGPWSRRSRTGGPEPKSHAAKAGIAAPSFRRSLLRTSLILAQSGHGVEARGTAGGQVACDSRRGGEHGDRGNDDRGVVRLHLVQEACHKPAAGERNGD